MELRQIQYFIAIAEAEHFGRAAQRLRIAQPALSRQMKLLEAELGIELFERLPRGVRLNAAGRTFLTEIRDVHGQIGRAVSAARAAAAGQHGRFRLSLIEAVAWRGLVPDAIRRYRSAFPAVDLSLIALPTAEQLAALRQRQSDAALIYNPQPAEDLAAIPLVAHPLVLAVPQDSPLASRPGAELGDLSGQVLIGFQRGASPVFFDDIQSSLRGAGIVPRQTVELVTETEILALVSAGAGVALVNACQIWRPPHGVRFLPMPDLAVRLRLALVHRRGDESPALLQFAAILTELAARETLQA